MVILISKSGDLDDFIAGVTSLNTPGSGGGGVVGVVVGVVVAMGS